MNWTTIAWAMSIGIIGQVIGFVVGYKWCKFICNPLDGMPDRRNIGEPLLRGTAHAATENKSNYEEATNYKRPSCLCKLCECEPCRLEDDIISDHDDTCPDCTDQHCNKDSEQEHNAIHNQLASAIQEKINKEKK